MELHGTFKNVSGGEGLMDLLHIDEYKGFEICTSEIRLRKHFPKKYCMKHSKGYIFQSPDQFCSFYSLFNLLDFKGPSDFEGVYDFEFTGDFRKQWLSIRDDIETVLYHLFQEWKKRVGDTANDGSLELRNL